MNCFEQWIERVFRYYERHIHENSGAGNSVTSLYNTAELTQPRRNMTVPLSRDGTWKPCEEQKTDFNINNNKKQQNKTIRQTNTQNSLAH